MTSPVRDSRARAEPEFNSPMVVEDLISGINDWRSVQDIVRLTFKALSDVVKSHSSVLKDLENQLSAKVSKSDFLQFKQTNSQVTSMIADIKTNLDSKVSVEDVYGLLESKSLKNEINKILANRVSADSFLSAKSDDFEVKGEYRRIKAGLDKLCDEMKEVNKKFVNKVELEGIYTQVNSKVSRDEFVEAMEEKANKQSVLNALHRKLNKLDFDSVIGSKVDQTELQHLADTIDSLIKTVRPESTKLHSLDSARKADYSDIESAMTLVQTSQKDSENRLFAYINKLDGAITTIRVKVDDLQSAVLAFPSPTHDQEKVALALARKADVDIVKSIQAEMQNLKIDLIGTNDRVAYQGVSHENWVRVVQTELAQANDTIMQISEQIRSNSEEKLKAAKLDRMDELRIGRQELERMFREIAEIRQHSIEQTEFRKSMEHKIETNDIFDYIDNNVRELGRKLQISMDELKELHFRSEKELKTLIDKKQETFEINSAPFENIPRIYRSPLEEQYKDDRYKSSFSLDSLNKQLKKLKFELDSKVFTFIKEQSQLNEMLCSENCVARWLWRTGQVRPNRAVAWDTESVNTCPENYKWQPGDCVIVTVSSGLYEVFYAVFASRKPSIEVLVNGETVFDEFRCLGKTWGGHTDGNIVAASLHDYVTLPARARITVVYNGEQGAGGVFGLRKL
jgi:hypothetical protein